MWQPIETAPRDQTFLAVLSCAGEQTLCTMRWAEVKAKNSRPDHYVFHIARVTHWMPLPALPGVQQSYLPSDLAEAIIADMQAQYNSEMITENDSGEALIRLDGAIAAVEDNFALAQPAPSVPEGWLRAIDEALVVAHIGVANKSDTYEQAKAKLGNLIGFHVDVATDPAVNGGWKLVPIEPTPEMRDAWDSAPICEDDDAEFRRAYQEMITSAPRAK